MLDERILEAQTDFCDFAETLKDIAPVMHGNPRILHQERNLEMEWYGEKNYFYFMYSSLDLIPGNFFDWSKEPHVKVNVEFDGMYALISIFTAYTEDRFIPLTKFIIENNLQLIIPEPKIEEEDDNQSVLVAIGAVAPTGPQKKKFIPRDKIKYFEVDGMSLYDMDLLKQFMMELDNQLHSYIIDDEI